MAPANRVGCSPQAISGRLVIADKARFPRKATEAQERTRRILLFKAELGLAELFYRYLLCSPRLLPNDGGDAAAKFEQAPLVFCSQARVGEAGEVQHRPKAIARIGEVVARGGGA